MQALAATLTPRLVRLRPDAEPVRVWPPSLRTAILLLAAQSRLELEGARAWDLLEQTARAWLPEGAAAEIFERDVPRLKIVAALSELLAVGAEDKGAHERRSREAQRKAAKTSWSRVLARYRHFYNCGSLEDVLGEPWPLWLRQHEEIGVLTARAQLQQAQWYAGARTGGLDSVMERADLPGQGQAGEEGPETPEKYTPPWEQEGISKAAWQQKKMQEAFNVKKRWQEKAEA